MRVSVSADERVGVADVVLEELRRRGHEVVGHGALGDGERDDWAWASEAAARDVAEGRADAGVVCCWTGTGASIAANKVPGVRAALCADAATADGARRWNDANVLALSLRTTSEAELGEILDAWFAGAPSDDAADRANVEHLGEIEPGPVRRLLPDPGETTLGDQLEGLDFTERAHAERPYTVTNFALTLDGRATLGGRSGPIGSDTDTALLVGLRLIVDALMIGAGTMRVEGYGPPVSDPAKRERRQARGLAADPLMVIIGSLDLPWEAPLFTEGVGEVLLFTHDDGDPPDTVTPLEVQRHQGQVDLVAAMAHLRTERGVRALLCEGGPHLHAQLIEAGLVDELFITHAPKLAGGEGPGLVAGLPERERPVEVEWLLEEAGELFGRYRVPG